MLTAFVRKIKLKININRNHVTLIKVTNEVYE
jgi:hypothetical protein